MAAQLSEELGLSTLNCGEGQEISGTVRQRVELAGAGSRNSDGSELYFFFRELEFGGLKRGREQLFEDWTTW